MQFNRWQHDGVKPNGTFENTLGAVHTEARTFYCDDECFIGVSEARTEEGTIRGVTFYFLTPDDVYDALRTLGSDPISVDDAIGRLAHQAVS